MLQIARRVVRHTANAQGKAPWARSLCLGPPPPADESYTTMASVRSAAEFHALTSNQKDKGGIDYIIAPMAVCIAFVSHADPACRSFGASMSQLADEHPAITFAKVDLEGEDAAMLAKEQGVQPDAKLPLFKRYKNGLHIAPDIVGGDAKALKHALEELAQP